MQAIAGPKYYKYMKVNAVGKEISEVQRAYLAGFLDADGAIMAVIEKHQEKKFGFRVRVIIKITQRDRKVLDWFMKNFRFGAVRQNRTTHDWIIKDQQVALNLLRMVNPYLKAKHRQAKIAQEILNFSINSRGDLLKVARLADTLSSFNVRSENRRKNFMAMI